MSGPDPKSCLLRENHQDSEAVSGVCHSCYQLGQRSVTYRNEANGPMNELSCQLSQIPSLPRLTYKSK